MLPSREYAALLRRNFPIPSRSLSRCDKECNPRRRLVTPSDYLLLLSGPDSSSKNTKTCKFPSMKGSNSKTFSSKSPNCKSFLKDKPFNKNIFLRKIQNLSICANKFQNLWLCGPFGNFSPLSRLSLSRSDKFWRHNN